MSKPSLLLLVPITILAFDASVCIAFAPATQRAFQPAKMVNGSTSYKQRIFFMSEEKGKEGTEVEVAPEAPRQPQGTYYDDEVEPVQNQGVSDAMRERLMREASAGLDPDAKQTNVLLYVMGVVAILVVLGGAGILY